MVIVNDVIKNTKQLIFDTYKIIFNVQDDLYDSFTRKTMVNEIFKYYNDDPIRIINFLTPEEISILKKIRKNGFESDSKNIFYRAFVRFLLVSYNSEFRYEIVYELEEAIDSALKLYKDNKYTYDRAKKNVFLAVGLFISYGALREKELKELLKNNDVSFDVTNDLYFKRFVKKDGSIYSLRNCDAVDYFSKKILKTHAKEFKTIYSKDILINRGRYLFDASNKNYINAIKSEKIVEYLRIFDIRLIELVGCNRIDLLPGLEWQGFTEDDYWNLSCLIDIMPRFFLTDNDKSVVSKETVDLFYSVFNDYLKFLARKNNVDILLPNNRIDGEHAYELFEDAFENEKTYYDDFVKNYFLDDAKNEMIRSILSGNLGLFTIYKHETDGTIFIDENSNIYKVKGLITPLKSLQGFEETPIFAKTLIFKYHNEWICCGLIQQLPIQIGPNIKKKLKEEYERATCDTKLTN